MFSLHLLSADACDLTLDPHTAGRALRLSDHNRTVTYSDEQPFPDQPQRFYFPQVLCKEGLAGRSYWEAEWSGTKVSIAVAYKRVKRKGDVVMLGCNDKSWSLDCTHLSYIARHSNDNTDIYNASSSRRVGVYLDWPAGILSFYIINSDTLKHLHTFKCTFTEPLYPAFWLWSDSSVSLCQIT